MLRAKAAQARTRTPPSRSRTSPSPTTPPGKRKRAGKREGAEGPHPDWGNDPDAVWALRDVELRASTTGEFFGIAGHTGSGK